MNAILTVVTPSPQVLTTLAALKVELGLTDTSSDAIIAAEIPRACGAIMNGCRRLLVAQGYSEQQRFPRVTSTGCSWAPGADVVRLAQYPADVTSVTADGTLLDPSCYEVDPQSGMIWRLSNDQHIRWCVSKLVVAYKGGYDSGEATHQQDLAVLERAAIDMIKLKYFATQRDPALRSENVLSGLYSYTLFDASTPDGSGPYADVERTLAPYRKVDR